MGRVEGKVAVITGAARGQGRSHAVKLASEGADIIAIDMCADIATNRYPLATVEDLEETARLVEKFERRIVTRQADVRDRAALQAAVDAGVTELGRLDIVIANAGICPLGGDQPPQAFADAVDVDLLGAINAIHAGLPHLTSGASIIATGSLAAFLPNTVDDPNTGPGGLGYGFAKQSLSAYIHTLALALAPQRIRANAVHPTNCDTDLLQNDQMYRTFRPDLENPTKEDAAAAFPAMTAMGNPWVEPEDISNAVLFLASDESRYVTGLQVRVDAGGYLKVHPFHV
jgi:SDR family mycofactocin-dependent oxidoreductase